MTAWLTFKKILTQTAELDLRIKQYFTFFVQPSRTNLLSLCQETNISFSTFITSYQKKTQKKYPDKYFYQMKVFKFLDWHFIQSKFYLSLMCYFKPFSPLLSLKLFNNFPLLANFSLLYMPVMHQCSFLFVLSISIFLCLSLLLCL